MADITKCDGENCSLKEKCFRYLVPANIFKQSYFLDAPIKKNNKCDHFIKADKKLIKNEH